MQKLMCYNWSDFKNIMAENGWNKKNLPSNIATIEICCTSDVTDYYGGLFGASDRPWFKNSDNSLVVFFDDITEDIRDIGDGKVAKGITNEQAKEIISFIEKNIDKDFYIRCHAGKSRSQAVVLYMIDFYHDHEFELNENNKVDYNKINGKVFRTLKNVKLGCIV